MSERIFLGIVGIAYLGLAIWCSIRPGQTSQSVGFTLTPGSGQSEFLVVYGGLELGLGIVFLIPLFRSETTWHALAACAIIHGCLVLFRSIGFILFSGIHATTYVLAIVEWLIFLGSLGFIVFRAR